MGRNALRDGVDLTAQDAESYLSEVPMATFSFPKGTTQRKKMEIAAVLWCLALDGNCVSRPTGRARDLLLSRLEKRGVKLTADKVRYCIVQLETGNWPGYLERDINHKRVYEIRLLKRPESDPFPPYPFDDLKNDAFQPSSPPRSSKTGRFLPKPKKIDDWKVGEPAETFAFQTGFDQAARLPTKPPVARGSLPIPEPASNPTPEPVPEPANPAPEPEPVVPEPAALAAPEPEPVASAPEPEPVVPEHSPALAERPWNGQSTLNMLTGIEPSVAGLLMSAMDLISQAIDVSHREDDLKARDALRDAEQRVDERLGEYVNLVERVAQLERLLTESQQRERELLELLRVDAQVTLPSS